MRTAQHSSEQAKRNNSVLLVDSFGRSPASHPGLLASKKRVGAGAPPCRARRCSGLPPAPANGGSSVSTWPSRPGRGRRYRSCSASPTRSSGSCPLLRPPSTRRRPPSLLRPPSTRRLPASAWRRALWSLDSGSTSQISCPFLLCLSTR